MPVPHPRERPHSLVMLLGLLITCSLAALIAGAGAAQAGATSGVSLSPVPAFDDEGRRQTVFRISLTPEGEERARFTVSNLTEQVQQARVYVASAEQGPGGGYDVGGPASARHLKMETQDLTLQPRETRMLEFIALAGTLEAGTSTTDAIVLEQESGSVVERAASLVYLKVERGLPVVPLALVVFAAACITAVAAGVWRTQRAQRRRGAAADAQR